MGPENFTDAIGVEMNRLMKFGSTEYPMAFAAQVKTELPAVKHFGSNKNSLVEHFKKQADVLENERKETNTLLERTTHANGFGIYYPIPEEKGVDLFPILDNPIAVVHDRLSNIIEARKHSLIEETGHSLMNSALKGIIGLVRVGQFDQSVVDYYHPQASTREITRRGEENGKTGTIYTQQQIYTATRRLMVESYTLPLEKGLKSAPATAVALAKFIPEFLKPLAYVIEGKQVQEQVFTQIVEQHRFEPDKIPEPSPEQILKYDPVLCLFPFVLFAWGPPMIH